MARGENSFQLNGMIFTKRGSEKPLHVTVVGEIFDYAG